MKKLISLLTFIFLILTLSGCTVNWFDRQYDVPWFVIAIPVAIIFIIAHIHIMSGTYACPNCSAVFKLKWYQISAYLHLGSKRYIKCPNCKKTDFCSKK